jgi:hypothetical protein
LGANGSNHAGVDRAVIRKRAGGVYHCRRTGGAAATDPVLNPPLSCVAVCVMESGFRQAIVWPTRMLTGLSAELPTA